MSCKISRRNFMRCAGIGALALASSSLLGGCTKFDAEYGLGETVTWTDKNGGTVSMKIAEAYGIPSRRVMERSDLSAAIDEMLSTAEQIVAKMPTTMFFTNIIYCWLYGTVLSAILSRKICPDNPF